MSADKIVAIIFVVICALLGAVMVWIPTRKTKTVFGKRGMFDYYLSYPDFKKNEAEFRKEIENKAKEQREKMISDTAAFLKKFDD